jgi:hypothetical protein
MALVNALASSVFRKPAIVFKFMTVISFFDFMGLIGKGPDPLEVQALQEETTDSSGYDYGAL